MTGCLPATERDFEVAQTIQEMSDAVNEIRLLSYELQDRVDSLTTVVAKRDTVIRQLANLAGVPMPP
jgi:methyl-accepting chemotaxis protein